ncbi:UNVERIFIED_CONTAM: hypothetical protein FKN15_060521 [Acipenser sinensis]
MMPTGPAHTCTDRGPGSWCPQDQHMPAQIEVHIEVLDHDAHRTSACLHR